tara:strand:+ start:1284 stop:1772 length:489 start_codon:yes stop_codon:yes gene_type:complete
LVVKFEFSKDTKRPRGTEHIRISGDDLLELLCAHQKFGFWRSELDTGHTFWSRDIFDIYGLPFTEGPVNLSAANAIVHPDDLRYMLLLTERSAREKTGFHYVLRLLGPHGHHRYVRSVGRYRVTGEGREELYGTFELFHDQSRLVGVVDSLDRPDPEDVSQP